MRAFICLTTIIVVLINLQGAVIAEDTKQQISNHDSDNVDALLAVDAGVKDDENTADSIRKTRQFGFGYGRPYYGGFGGFGYPGYYGGYGGYYGGYRPYYGGGFGYRPYPYYGIYG